MGLDFVTWFKKALVFLVASCPCSIVISIPLAYFSCIGEISKKGLLIKGTKHIDALSKAKVVAFDKTGTITTGKMEIKEIVILDDNITKEEMLTDMYSLENNSNHPISTAILNYASKNNLDRKNVDNQKEIVGCGIIGNIENNQLIIGNFKMLEKNNLDYKNMDIPENAVIFVKNKKIEGYIILEEKVRDEVNETIQKLKKI